jgi:hypothetical protein
LDPESEGLEKGVELVEGVTTWDTKRGKILEVRGLVLGVVVGNEVGLAAGLELVVGVLVVFLVGEDLGFLFLWFLMGWGCVGGILV